MADASDHYSSEYDFPELDFKDSYMEEEEFGESEDLDFLNTPDTLTLIPTSYQFSLHLPSIESLSLDRPIFTDSFTTPLHSFIIGVFPVDDGSERLIPFIALTEEANEEAFLSVSVMANSQLIIDSAKVRLSKDHSVQSFHLAMNDFMNNPIELEVSLKYYVQPNQSKLFFNRVGLINDGMTCYLNALIQALFNLSAFRKLVYTLPLSKSDITDSLIFLFARMQKSYKPVSTRQLTKAFNWEESDLFMQHDGQELMRILFDRLDKEASTYFKGKNKITIKANGFEQSHVEEFDDISLGVKDLNTIEESLEANFQVDKLTGPNQYTLPSGEKVDAEMHVEIVEKPEILCLHLRRFEYVDGQMQKLNNRFEFGEELDFKGKKYHLNSIVTHSGNAYGGHYVCYSKCGDMWLLFDDESIHQLPSHEVFEENYYGAYMLFYSAIEEECVPVPEAVIKAMCCRVVTVVNSEMEHLTVRITNISELVPKIAVALGCEEKDVVLRSFENNIVGDIINIDLIQENEKEESDKKVTRTTGNDNVEEETVHEEDESVPKDIPEHSEQVDEEEDENPCYTLRAKDIQIVYADSTDKIPIRPTIYCPGYVPISIGTLKVKYNDTFDNIGRDLGFEGFKVLSRIADDVYAEEESQTVKSGEYIFEVSETEEIIKKFQMKPLEFPENHFMRILNGKYTLTKYQNYIDYVKHSTTYRFINTRDNSNTISAIMSAELEYQDVLSILCTLGSYDKNRVILFNQNMTQVTSASLYSMSLKSRQVYYEVAPDDLSLLTRYSLKILASDCLHFRMSSVYVYKGEDAIKAINSEVTKQLGHDNYEIYTFSGFKITPLTTEIDKHQTICIQEGRITLEEGEIRLPVVTFNGIDGFGGTPFMLKAKKTDTLYQLRDKFDWATQAMLCVNDNGHLRIHSTNPDSNLECNDELYLALVPRVDLGQVFYSAPLRIKK